MFRVNESMQFRFNSMRNNTCTTNSNKKFICDNLRLKSNSLASITEERTNASINRCVVMHAQTLAKKSESIG